MANHSATQPAHSHVATVRAIFFRAFSHDTTTRDEDDFGDGHELLIWSLDSSQYTALQHQGALLQNSAQDDTTCSQTSRGALVVDKNVVRKVDLKHARMTVGDISGLYGVALSLVKNASGDTHTASTEHLISLALASARQLAEQCLISLRLNRFGNGPGIMRRSAVDAVVERIVECYEVHLKYTPKNDRWLTAGETGGRHMFAKQVAFYVQRGMRLTAVLPAFPCKSSNLDKVSGVLPDKGEELALRTLKLFIDAVRDIYPPGITVVIVSDGHVFSDLVCTDDHIVDLYNKHFKLMAQAILSPDEVSFAGLDDLLDRPTNFDFPHDSESEPIGRGIIVTKKTPEAEMGRKWLMDMFGKDGELDTRLAVNPALMGLCRGFSRFVLEDMAQHPGVRRLSLNQRRKIAWDTAKWMIQRNEAYSSLVQARFPAAIRFSIHPHDNSGPKFAISLLHPSLRPPGETGPAGSAANFHIPTPWHNVVLELPYGGYVFVKRRLLNQLAASDHEVTLVRADKDTPGQGIFYRLAV